MYHLCILFPITIVVEETSKPTWHQFVVRRPGLRDYVASTVVKGYVNNNNNCQWHD